MATITLGLRGETLIKSYETLRLKAYRPTPNDVLTIGWGHTKGVRLGQVITVDQAEVYFKEDASDAIKVVDLLYKKMSNGSVRLPLTQSMTDSLISLVFNVGPSCVSSGSTIGRELIESRNYFAAWRGFSLWTKQAGNDLLGLARRRSKEMELFLEDGLPE